MAKFTVEIDCDNAAFQPSPDQEISEVLERVLTWIDQGKLSGVLYDTNGNRVGSFRYDS